MNNPTVYQNLITRFARNGNLTASQQSELDAIVLAGDVDRNSTFWVHFLPLYFLMARRDDEKIVMSELLTAIEGSGKNKRGVDQNALAEAIAARLENMLEDISPNTDPVVLARAVAKAAAPAIQQAAEDAIGNTIQQPKVDLAPLQSIIKETMQQAQASFNEVGRDAFFNRHIVIMAAAGILMAIVGVWWGGHLSDVQWQNAYTQSQGEIKDLKLELKSYEHIVRKK